MVRTGKTVVLDAKERLLLQSLTSRRARCLPGTGTCFPRCAALPVSTAQKAGGQGGVSGRRLSSCVLPLGRFGLPRLPGIKIRGDGRLWSLGLLTRCVRQCRKRRLRLCLFFCLLVLLECVETSGGEPCDELRIEARVVEDGKHAAELCTGLDGESLALDIMEGQALSVFIGPFELSLTQDDILIHI